MLKTFELCPRKFEFRYIKNISMPTNDDIFEFGKNIHAMASYYLKGEFIDNMEKSLSQKEIEVWNHLRESKYFAYDVINTEYQLNVKIGKNFFGGRLDALVKDNNCYYILDYKTGSIPQNPRYDFQTMIYILAVKEFFDTENMKFVYLDLKNRDEIVITYTPELYSEYCEKLNKITSEIERYEIYPKKKDCKCEYSMICY